MRLKKWLGTACMALALLGLAAGPAPHAAELTKVATAWMGEQETFPIWYAKDQGWDKELGLDVNMLYFNSGMDSMNTLPAGSWVFAGIGAVPTVIGALRYDVSVIAMCNDEAQANAVLVRPDSPIAKVKGWNKDHPEILGSPETVKGITVLTTTVSSSHYALYTWLKSLGLTEKDVTIMNMEQASALAAFEYGIGDAVVLWAPLTYVGINRGWQVASTPLETGHVLPLVIVANRTYAEKNPEITAKFLDLYMRGLDHMKNTPIEKLIPEYLRFYNEWAGAEYTEQLAVRDIKSHNLYSLDEQKKLFDTSNGPSQVQQWFTSLAEFFADTGRLNRQDLAKVHGSAFVTNKYLNMLAPHEHPNQTREGGAAK